ncbi:enoyl-CoA hydratase/isomerase family protein [Maribius pontilimi]|uniref:Enoyl-CoA hydratase/isomerase family protein n=1 Tax=Palleronia pontilimi TaxID=1964209 RepID=A0A934MDX4_9RHOB|nr:enoyl-CoA hydratase/isomerase family protein [Palleronia pontilimi]MBJ3762841.1 enoyl-CoA hydratase/isomerase family protein [Palleronia pontilimi]
MSVKMTDGVAQIALPAWLDAAGLGALSLELAQALGDPAVKGITLIGGARAFCLGLPVDAPRTDTPRDLARRIRVARKPVVAAIRGAAQGAGLELALAARMRVAHPQARVSLPQIRTGQPPSALGSQTLPVLVGADAALRMLLGGATLAADAAPDGLIDLLDDAPEDAAAALARAAASAPDRMGLADPQAYLAAVAKARTERSILDVRARIVDCVEAALILPGFAAEQMEAQADADAQASPASRALRRLARDEAANAQRDVTATLPPRVAILGGTTIAGRLAEACLHAGAEVDLVALDDAGLAHAAGTVIDRVETLAAAGGISAERIDGMLNLFRPGVDMEPLRKVGFVVEAATGDPGLRAELAQAIELFTEPGTPIALGGSDTDPGAHLSSDRSGDALGFHLPPGADGLAEIAITDATTPLAREAGVALARALGRRAILTGVSAGRVVAKLAEVSLATAEAMIVEGADPARIDTALKDRFAIARGPLARAQAAGLAATQKRRAALGWGQGALIELMVSAGLASLDDAAAVAAELRASDDRPRRAWTDTAIANRWLAALTGAAARLLSDGAVRRASDLNIASLPALDLPRLSGGLLFAADRAGLLELQNILRAAGETPPDLLESMVKNGQRFGDL